MENSKPPFFKSWRQFYAVAIVETVIIIALLYAFTDWWK